MCGICGIVDFRQGRSPEEKLLRSMCRQLAHRGPDDEGVYFKGPAGLGHRRLSIIDIEGGRQPMADGDRSLWTVFNGEIYNFKFLREELKKGGVLFRTESDTECLLYLYLRDGLDMFTQLRGMFSFALWDEKQQRLIMARDRVGQKPLYFFSRDSWLVFASELKVVLEHPEVSREPDPEAFDDFLTYSCVPAPGAMIRGVRKLPPGHFLIFDKTGLRIEQYWDLQFDPEDDMTFDEARSEVLDKLRQAVQLRMISDVPLGAFLSGGIDSSLVVALMSEAGSKPVNTFTIGFEEKKWNETEYARLVAERYGTKHRQLIVKPDALKMLPRMIEHFNEPFGDSSAIPTFYLAEMTRKEVTVALNGDGGDELFGGYPRHLGMLLLEKYRQLPKWFRENIVPMAVPGRMTNHRLLRRIRRLNQASFNSLEEAYCSFLEIHSPDAKQSLIGKELKDVLGKRDAREQLEVLLESDRGGEELLGRILYSDLKLYLPDDLLVKIDRMTMAHGLEARSPFLDHELVELVARIPAKYKIRYRTQKFLLKSIAKNYLDRELIDRPKMGFAVPLDEWLRQDLKKMAEEIIKHSRFVEMGWFDREGLDRLWGEHLKGAGNHSHKLWGIIQLEMWYRRFIENRELDIPV